MAAPVVSAVLQWCDAEGVPYASGTITTYIVGTGTPKQTFSDPGLTAANPNPVVLDSAGRSIMWGDGAYRLVLRDRSGNLVFDQPATTIVSAAMAPVVSAPTIADAWHQLGGDAAIAAEAAARSAADSAEQAARIAADTTLTNADIAINASISAEVTARTNADTNLQNQINTIVSTPSGGVLPPGYTMRAGSGTTDFFGLLSVTFATAFPTACDAVTATPTSPDWYTAITAVSAAGFDIHTTSLAAPSPSVSNAMSFYFIAVGH